MIHLGDITKISGYDAPPVDCIIGGSPCQDLSVAGKRAGLAGQRSGLFMEQIRIVKEMRDADRLRGRTGQFIKPRYMVWENVCFAAGTLVTCDGGYKNIEDVAIGDKVKTLSGEYRPVAACYKTPKVEVMSVKASGSEPLTVTTNHPFWAREKSYAVNGQREYGAPQWVEAGKLTKNHMIAYRLDIPTLPDDFISTDVAWALGRWLADGSVDLNRSNPRIFISCGKSKVDATRERLNKLPYEIYENSPHSTAVNFSFTSFEFYRLIESAGKGAGNKKVPPFVFELPVGLQKSFLDGYLSGDGYSRCRNGSIEFSASTASRQLAYGITRVFRNVYHAQASVSRHKAKEGTISGRKIHANYPSYSIGAVINGKCQRWFYEDGVIWAPVISVERNGETANVYNLSVIGDNTYGANDIMVHNCGAFSSNHGEDFRAVLEETIRIAEPEAPDIPLPEKRKWSLADAYYGDGWSVAYRVLDAQFWGVPQRRRRIALVADFGGQSAPEILFERNGLSWDTPEGAETGQAVAGGTGQHPGETDTEGGVRCLTPWDTQSARVYGEDGAWHSLNANENGGMSRDAILYFDPGSATRVGGHVWNDDVAPALRADPGDNHPTVLVFAQNQRNEVRDLHDVAGSLAAEPGMKQQTFVCAGFKYHQGAEAGSIGFEQEKSPTLSTDHNPAIICMATQQGGAEIRTDDKAPTLTAAAGMSGNNQPVICLQGNAVDRNVGQHGSGISQEPMFTLNATDRHAVYDARGNGNGETVPTITGDHENRVTDYTAIVFGQQGFGDYKPSEVCSSVKARDWKDATDLVCAAVDCRNGVENAEVNGTLQAKSTGGSSLNLNNVVREAGTVRRLTPVECERLQGFPDNWTDIGDWTDEKGKVHKTSDAARYKALGNSIALPPWKWVLKRLCAMYERDATLGSLFDGIGGFPRIWEQLNGEGTCLWASEIEPFCIAVTKKRFGGPQ